MVDGFSSEEKSQLLSVARNAILEYLSQGKKIYPETDNPNFSQKRGIFVTLHQRHDLRGCIGYPLPEKPVIEAVVDNAISSAVHDPRFKPLKLEELSQIHIEVSVLTLPIEVKRVEDVVVGRDGIIISKGFHRGLLLPQVPVEQHWDREQYISYGCLKAGLDEGEWKRGVKIQTFQAEVFTEKESK